MKDPLGVSPSKGNQGTTRGKGKILGGNGTHDLRTRSTVTLPTELILCSSICVYSATRHNIHCGTDLAITRSILQGLE